MVPKIHAKGSSFVGIGQYILHDKDHAHSSERVEWTLTKNLMTDDPELAVRLMAATAMDADRLKANAGVKNTGRKSSKSVLHLSLAWHPSEGDELIPEEMQRAAELAIKALGAEDRQALIVAHNDEQQPHIHIVINRVSPEDGRMLSSSKEKLHLSRFAEKYEKERGEVLCEQRVINNAARDRGEYVRGEKDVPRHIYDQHLANDNRPGNGERHRKQRDKDRAVGQEQRAMRDRQAAAWARLDAEHKARRAAIFETQKRKTLKATQEVRESFRANQWTGLHHEHQAELRAFTRDEERFLGRMKNRAKAFDLREMIGSDDRKKAISDAFTALSSSGARLEWLKRSHAKREAGLKAEQKRMEDAAAREVREQTQAKLRKARHLYEGKRASLAFTCAGESAKMRAEWKQRATDRAAELAPTRTPQSSPEGRQGIELDDRLKGLLSDYEQRMDQYEQRRDDARDRDRDDEIDR